MDSLMALVKSSRRSPDKLYAKAFLHFQALFRSLKGDVSTVQLPSHMPESVYGDRRTLGVVITAALVAMLDHRLKTGGAKIALKKLLWYTLLMPPGTLVQLDDIILAQASTIGVGIFASELAHSRFLDWQQDDYPRFKRGLRALDRAARVAQQMMPTPLTDPFRREVKERALTELRPAVKRLQEGFKMRRQQPNQKQILKEFTEEARRPEFTFLSNEHNLNLWLRFLSTDPLALLDRSAAELYDDFTAFVTSHSSDYTRRKVSSRT